MKDIRQPCDLLNLTLSSRRKAKKQAQVTVACFESLEGRRLMSGVTAILASGVLTVNGTMGNDVISLALNGSNIRVHDSGVLVNSFATSQVTSTVINGLAGNDLITVASGVPGCNISGGGGADTITTANGHDTVSGGKGQDSLTATGSSNQLYGLRGADTIVATGHKNLLSGGPGNDLIVDQTNGSSDTVQGNGGSGDAAEGFADLDTVTGVEETVPDINSTEAPDGFNSFDISSNTNGTLTSNDATFNPAGNYNPTVPNARADYGAATNPPTLSSQNSTLPSPLSVGTSGSVKLSGTYNVGANGSNNTLAVTIDLFPNAVQFTTISFDVMVDPSSVTDAFGGYGYLGLLTRDSNYGTHTVNSADGAAVTAGFELGTGTGPVPQAGVWYHVYETLDDTNNQVRAITIQDYGGAGQNLTGNVSLYIDNLAFGN